MDLYQPSLLIVLFFQSNILDFFKSTCTQFQQRFLGVSLSLFPSGWLMIFFVSYLLPFRSHDQIDFNWFILVKDTKKLRNCEDVKRPGNFYSSCLFFRFDESQNILSSTHSWKSLPQEGCSRLLRREKKKKKKKLNQRQKLIVYIYVFYKFISSPLSQTV